MVGYMNRLSISLPLAALCAALMLSGCVGDLPSDDQIEQKVDALAQADLAVQDAGSDVADTAEDTAADVAEDAGTDAGTDAGKDTGSDADEPDNFEPECITNDDCKGRIKGVTSCNVPFCEAGICTLKQLDKGTACTPSIGTATECEVAECSSTGTCDINDRPDGDACGPYKCGKQCTAGKCVPVGPEVYDDGNPCTNDYCKDGNAVVHEKISKATAKCEDGDPCTKTGFCFDGACTADKIACDDGNSCTVGVCKSGEGCKFLGDDTKCDDGDPCTKEKCDTAAGCAVVGFAEATVTCDDGNTCTKDDHCAAKGACVGTSTCACKVALDCKQENLCLGEMTCTAGKCEVDLAKAVTCSDDDSTECALNTCDPATGQCELVDVTDGETCNDGNACTTKSACDGGECLGKEDVGCDDKNPCTDDFCDAIDGCENDPAEAKACDDGNACTSGDVCSKGACVGTPKDCDDGVSCTVDSCDSKAGGAASGKCASKTDDGSCDDGNPCTTDTCDAKDGCASAADDKGKCDDGNTCTEDVCKSGTCVGTNICECKADKDCDDGNPCTKDSCAAGKCKAEAVADSAKQACDTGDKCQLTNSGLCQAGVCKSGNKPKDCSGSGDACNVGTCEPKTGKCVATPKSEGATCDADGSGCTVNDFCKAGKCEKGAAPDCSKVGGQCVKPTCESTGKTTYSCKAVPRGATVGCDDGKWCTHTDKCDGKGACKAGPSRTCANLGDACNDGLCNESKKQCEAKAKPSTTTCSDGFFCTDKDHCSGGKCVGGSKKVCEDDGECTVGVCVEDDDECDVEDAKEGAACDDGNKCTASDKCDKEGDCDGASTVPCKGPAKVCHSQVCNPLTGGCGYEPVADGADCEDGEKCTINDSCDGAGKCVPGKWNSGLSGCGCKEDKDCNDGNACTKDVCDNGTCENKIEKGQTCNDGDSCSTESKCNEDGACAATKKHVCMTADACNNATCDGSGALPKCGKSPKKKGTKCNDDAWCTALSACNSVGACVGTKKRNCSDGKFCTNDKCDEKANKCVSTPKKCDDGDPCTLNKCTELFNKCYFVKDTKKCNDGNSCTNDRCNSSNGSCSHTNYVNGRSCSGSDKCKVYQCKTGKCTDSGKTKCNDNNPCTNDNCSSTTGKCSFPIATGKACDDGNKCTIKDQCLSGFNGAMCAGQTNPGGCDDDNPCTKDFCSKSKGCVNVAGNDGGKCDDGDKCTTGDVCSSGKCDGAVRTCDDNTPCTIDSCVGSTGKCKHSKQDPKCIGPKCVPGKNDCPKSSDACLKSKCEMLVVPGKPPTPMQCSYVEKCNP